MRNGSGFLRQTLLPPFNPDPSSRRRGSNPSFEGDDHRRSNLLCLFSVFSRDQRHLPEKPRRPSLVQPHCLDLTPSYSYLPGQPNSKFSPRWPIARQRFTKRESNLASHPRCVCSAHSTFLLQMANRGNLARNLRRLCEWLAFASTYCNRPPIIVCKCPEPELSLLLAGRY